MFIFTLCKLETNCKKLAYILHRVPHCCCNGSSHHYSWLHSLLQILLLSHFITTVCSSVMCQNDICRENKKDLTKENKPQNISLKKTLSNNAWQSLQWVHHPQFCSTYVLYTLLVYSKHISVLYFNYVCHEKCCSEVDYYLHTELVELNVIVQIQHVNNTNYRHPWLQRILRGVQQRSIICEV
jgi:hypothetical protein